MCAISNVCNQLSLLCLTSSQPGNEDVIQSVYNNSLVAQHQQAIHFQARCLVTVLHNGNLTGLPM